MPIESDTLAPQKKTGQESRFFNPNAMAPVPDSGEKKTMHKSLVIVFSEDVLYNLIKHEKLHLLIRIFRIGLSTRLKIGAWAVGLE